MNKNKEQRTIRDIDPEKRKELVRRENYLHHHHRLRHLRRHLLHLHLRLHNKKRKPFKQMLNQK